MVFPVREETTYRRRFTNAAFTNDSRIAFVVNIYKLNDFDMPEHEAGF